MCFVDHRTFMSTPICDRDKYAHDDTWEQLVLAHPRFTLNHNLIISWYRFRMQPIVNICSIVMICNYLSPPSTHCQLKF